MLDYELLRIIWWLLIGVLLISFAIMDGFDIGVAILLPWIGKDDIQRRIILNCVSPVWESNQVWLLLGAGAIFAAWPQVYAVSFSCFYLVMFLLLVALIFRPIAFTVRSKIENKIWRVIWDYILSFGGIIMALVYGVAVGNVILGIPFQFDDDLRIFYSGDTLQFFTLFPIMVGLLSLTMLITHGAIYIGLKTNTPILDKACRTYKFFSILTILFFCIIGIWVLFGMEGYQVQSLIDYDKASNPLMKLVTKEVGAWSNNYILHPWFICIPLLGILGSLYVAFTKKLNKSVFIASSISIIGMIGSVGFSMFPFILPSSIHPMSSLMVFDSSSSHLTLFLMLMATIFLLPIVVLYIKWLYKIMHGKIDEDRINRNINSY